MPQANMANSVVHSGEYRSFNIVILIQQPSLFTLRRWFEEPILSVVRHAESEHAEQRVTMFRLHYLITITSPFFI
jgi:hypothetical protein